jgi:hypothetical protein
VFALSDTESKKSRLSSEDFIGRFVDISNELIRYGKYKNFAGMGFVLEMQIVIIKLGNSLDILTKVNIPISSKLDAAFYSLQVLYKFLFVQG